MTPQQFVYCLHFTIDPITKRDNNRTVQYGLINPLSLFLVLWESTWYAASLVL